MAIESNASEQEVASGGGVQLYVGIAPVKVVAVNPTIEELKDKLGITLKREPEYLGVSILGETYNKITFWVECIEPKIITKFDILVKPEDRVSKAGKPQWINAFGVTTWSDDTPNYDWYKLDGVRHAFVGEDTLIEFIKAYANVANGGKVSFDDPKAIAKGDVKEIKALIDALSENRVRVLLGVKEGKYQQVYTKHFGRLKPFRKDMFIKMLNDDFGSFNAEYNQSLELEVYVPGLVGPDAEVAAEESTEPDW